MREPLNPVLYKLLERRFGMGNVEIVSTSQAIDWRVAKVPKKREKGYRFARRVTHSGEEYKVNCPFCNDTRQRLYINHRWGVKDDITDTKNLWLAQCFNEQCLSDYGNQQQFYEQIYTHRNRNRKIIINPGVEVKPGEAIEQSPPGPMWRLDKLIKTHPRHHAIRYLEGRFLNPERLGRIWHLAYCPQSKFPLAANRIIIPVYSEGKMVGWQARYIGEDVDGMTFKEAKIPKYWTMPGFKRRFVAYNFELAIRHSTVIVVEGPADVWGAGPQSMCLFGKTMSPFLQKKLTDEIRQRHGDKAVVVVMLDPTQDPDAKARLLPHHISKLCMQLAKPMRKRVVPVYLPKGSDPGSLDRDLQRAAIKKAAAKRGITIDFTKPQAK